MGSKMSFYLWQGNEAGINPGLPGEDELQSWWTPWWDHYSTKTYCQAIKSPLAFSKHLLHQQPNPSLVLDGPEESGETTWWWKDPGEKTQNNAHKSSRKVFNVSAYLLGLSFFSGVSSTNRSVGLWHQRLCCQTVEDDTRSYLIVNSKNKSIALLQLRLHHF